MGWRAGDGSRPEQVPGGEAGLPGPGELLAGFAHGGVWDEAVPSALLAAALEAAAGPGGRYEGADVGALVGIARQWAAVESWAAAGLLGTLRAMSREDRDGTPLLRRRGDLPEGWDDSVNYEVAAALAMGPVSAGNLAALAHALGTRLPGIGRLLAEGALTRAKAKLVAGVFGPLDDGEAARAEALVAGELAGKTYFQVERLAWRAALAVAPDVAGRRRAAAERDRARVTVFREESGAVGLSGRDLPAAQALAGHAAVLARAGEYEASGAFAGQGTGRLEALAYLHLLNGVSAADAIAFARTAGPSGDEHHGGDGVRGDGGDGDDDGDDGGQGPGGGSPRGGSPCGTGPGGGGRPACGGAALPEVAVPLAALQGLAAMPGENRLLGPLDPALARDLAAAAARSSVSRWEVTIVDDRGYAVGHGTARPASGTPQRPPGGARPAFPARVNVTVTETVLHRLAAQAAAPRSGAPPGERARAPLKRPARSPGTAGDGPEGYGTWALAPLKRPASWPGAAGAAGGEPGGYGTWTLTLPGGRPLRLRLDVVPTHACDHQYQASGYQPGGRLRRLVQVRDQECTFPTCSRPARQSDFEHAVPYDQGGRTCACNAGARSRRCHQVKQSSGWTVTQPKPGWHEWTTPTGRTYVQEPWRYIA